MLLLCTPASTDYGLAFLVTIQSGKHWDITTAITDIKIWFFYSPFGEYYYLHWLNTQNFTEGQKFSCNRSLNESKGYCQYTKRVQITMIY